MPKVKNAEAPNRRISGSSSPPKRRAVRELEPDSPSEDDLAFDEENFDSDGSAPEETGFENDSESQEEEGENQESGDSDESSGDGESDEEEESGDELDQKMKMIKKQLASIPFEQQLELQKQGFGESFRKLSRKSEAPTTAAATSGAKGAAKKGAGAKGGQPEAEKKKKRHSSMPQELSAKKPVSRFKQVVHVPKKLTRDPRFDRSSGDFDSTSFHKSYQFLNEYKMGEAESMREQMKRTESAEERKEMQKKLTNLQRDIKEQNRKASLSQKMTEWRQKERELVSKGKTPYFLKKSDIKKMALADRYDELKKTGHLEKFMEKKRKKTAAKDHRYLPYARRDEN